MIRFWSLASARVVAVRKLEVAGVPRTAVDAGFEYNAWTELSISGHLNNRRVTNPPGAYLPGLSQTPSVVPVYRLEYVPTPETAPSEFSSVPYFSLLPPFHKQVRIDRTRLVAIISDALCQAASEPIPLIKAPQRQQSGITGDLTARKISSNGAVSVEGKGKLWYITRCHV